MRSATIAAASVVLVGAYLAVGGAVGLAPAAIALGVSAIALVAAVTAVAASGASGRNASEA